MDELNTAPFFTPLKQIFHPKGNVFHAMKRSDEGYVDFGEAYFTTVHFAETKGWKLHKRMQMNLIVPIGDVKFYVRSENGANTQVFECGEENYGRLTIPPGHWVAFTGRGEKLNLVLNLASVEHDPEEALNVPLDTFPLNGGT